MFGIYGVILSVIVLVLYSISVNEKAAGNSQILLICRIGIVF